MKIGSAFGSVLGGFFQIAVRVSREKSDSQRAEKSKKYGIGCLILGVISLVSIYFCSRWAVQLIHLATTENYLVIGNMLVIVFGIAVAIIPLSFMVNTLSLGITQFCINKKPFSIIVFIFSILVVLAVIGIFIWQLTLIKPFQ